MGWTMSIRCRCFRVVFMGLRGAGLVPLGSRKRGAASIRMTLKFSYIAPQSRRLLFASLLPVRSTKVPHGSLSRAGRWCPNRYIYQ